MVKYFIIILSGGLAGNIWLFPTISDLVVGTDMFAVFGETATFDAEPFVMVEAKAVALHAQLHYPHHKHHNAEDLESNRASEVRVTIGLFSIVNMFRLVNLSVESKGFDIPRECTPMPSPVNPCAVFEDMDFPIDIFAPPLKKGHDDKGHGHGHGQGHMIMGAIEQQG